LYSFFHHLAAVAHKQWLNSGNPRAWESPKPLYGGYCSALYVLASSIVFSTTSILVKVLKNVPAYPAHVLAVHKKIAEQLLCLSKKLKHFNFESQNIMLLKTSCE
jgi:hypothetical protein